MISTRKFVTVTAALAIFAAGLFGNDGNVVTRGLLSQAQARVGRPLTPMSYAGVARRTTRRAVAVGAVAAGAYAVTPGCVQVTDAYGRIVTKC
jgi:hypothetical protein